MGTGRREKFAPAHGRISRALSNDSSSHASTIPAQASVQPTSGEFKCNSGRLADPHPVGVRQLDEMPELDVARVELAPRADLNDASGFHEH